MSAETIVEEDEVVYGEDLEHITKKMPRKSFEEPFEVV